MTRVVVDHDEWWPVPQIKRSRFIGHEEIVDIPEDIVKRFEKANDEFSEAWGELIDAAAQAGHTYWKEQT